MINIHFTDKAKKIYGSIQRDLLRYARAIYFDLFECYIHKGQNVYICNKIISLSNYLCMPFWIRRDEYYIDGYQVIVLYNCFSQLLCLLFLGMYKQVSKADSHGTFKELYKSHVICFNLYLIQVSSYIRYLLHYTVYDVCSFENSYF